MQNYPQRIRLLRHLPTTPRVKMAFRLVSQTGRFIWFGEGTDATTDFSQFSQTKAFCQPEIEQSIYI